MIKTSDIEIAVAAARAGLADDHSWIATSALHERAYFIGLYTGLTALASSEARGELDRLVLPWVMETAFARPGDDPFRATPAAGCLSKLAAAAQDPDSPLDKAELATELRNVIERTLDRAQHHCSEALKLLDSSTRLNPRTIHELETHLRALASPSA